MNLKQLKELINSIPDTLDTVEVYIGSTDSFTTDSGTDMRDNEFELFDENSIKWACAEFNSKSNGMINSSIYSSGFIRGKNKQRRQFICISNSVYGAPINKPYDETDFQESISYGT